MFILNKQQEFIVNEAVRWFYNSSNQTFEFAGYSGTGKSVVLNEIVKRLNLKDNEVLPMAFTGQASIVMRKKGFPTATTCHSGLFTPFQEVVKDDFGRPLINKQFNTPILKWKFIPIDFKNSPVRLIVLDEAYMIPKRFRKVIENTGIKVLAAGDPGQLPPIGDDPGYLVDENIYFLTDIMRQAETSAIIYIANRVRQGLPVEYGLYGNDALVIFDDELDNDIISRSEIVLCGKNSTRENLNRRVRESIFNIHTDYPNYGERLICRKNNWKRSVNGISLVNGLTGTVISPPDIGRFSGELMTLDFFPDLLNEPFYNIDINHKYLNAKYQEKEELKMNPWLTGDLFEYAYASTVHLCQGSEYNSGTYIEEYMRSDMQDALNYTAITRFKNKLIYVKHEPKYWVL